MYDKELNMAMEAAKEAGKYLYSNSMKATIKLEEGKDIKLVADIQSESIIVSKLSSSNISILSEEKGAIGDLDNKFWIIDPLDGSANYLRGLVDLSCVSIALWDKGEPVLGVVYCWHSDDIYTGVLGTKAKKNGKEIMTSNKTDMGHAYIATGFPVKRNYSFESLSNFIKKVQKFKKVRMLGTAALSGVMVAEGKLDAYIEDEIMLWDIAASYAIAKAAGAYCELNLLEKFKCDCHLFCTRSLMEDYEHQNMWCLDI